MWCHELIQATSVPNSYTISPTPIYLFIHLWILFLGEPIRVVLGGDTWLFAQGSFLSVVGETSGAKDQSRVDCVPGNCLNPWTIFLALICWFLTGTIWDDARDSGPQYWELNSGLWIFQACVLAFELAHQLRDSISCWRQESHTWFYIKHAYLCRIWSCWDGMRTRFILHSPSFSGLTVSCSSC